MKHKPPNEVIKMNKKHLFWIIPVAILLGILIGYYSAMGDVYTFLHSNPESICADLLENF